MNNILLYLLESGTCLLVFYLLYELLLKRETCFLYNRFYLLITPLLSFIIPLVELPFLQPEPFTIFVAQQLAPITITVNASAPSSNSTILSWQTLLGILYTVGVAFFSFRLGKQLYLLHQFAQKTQPDSFYWQNIPVHKTQGAQPTFSFWNCIFWDNSQTLSTSEKERILLHEAVHIRQKHSLDILYLELFRIIFWFNPLLYLYQQALTNTHEFIADAAVLRTTSPETYTSLLARQMLHSLEFSFGNYFNKSLTLKRMKMIQQIPHRPSIIKLLAALPVLGILLFVLSCAEPENPVNQSSKGNSKTNTLNIDGEEVFTFVEQAPNFPGGMEKMVAFLGKNIKYPEAAINANLEGTVVAEFVVTKAGKITDIKIVKSLSPETNAEAKRVISLMPNWEPGKQDGKPLHVKYTLPIRFALGEPATEKIRGFTPYQDDQNKNIFTQVEVLPQFPGGIEKMYSFLGKNIKYPAAAQKAKKEGTVVVTFVITDQGIIKDLEIVKGLTAETNAEALRVIKLMPPWTPGKQNGKPVNVQYTLPLRFSLGARSTSIQTSYINWTTPLQNNC
ncbi:M56 family metallopeptidase [Adhaeribacter radiodurans]|uniref:M56 family metallopeptidase n=1 Tax=Adhaeribacter radiodurans TaxID=2745197 RepID=A0A7L7LAD8_9BACT|nr:M56 family metallopeptidase [Adhaeribacter radiodurans]QMU29798.1 M56 family metallopeptidase [Adhaeribacter radiodurans]